MSRQRIAAIGIASIVILAPARAWARSAAVVARQVHTRVVLEPGVVDPDRATIDGWDRDASPGRPRLPHRDVLVVLHPDADLRTLRLEVRSGPTDTLGFGTLLPPAAPPMVFDPRIGRWRDVRAALRPVTGPGVAEKDPSAYGAAIYPRAVIERRRLIHRGGVRQLLLRYRPLRYRHITGELLLDRHTEVALHYRLIRGVPAPHAASLSPRVARDLRRRALNPGQAHRWYGATASMAQVTPHVGYAIVIRDDLRERSREIEAFIAHKESQGMRVHLVGDAELGAVDVGLDGGDPERIRGWLQQNYLRLNLRYALLIGNPDPNKPGVPMKLTYPLAGSVLASSDAPTDHYYADLTGDWDLDGDGLAGEYPDDRGDGGVDFNPELHVGRIPVYDGNVAALDRILRKTREYATDRRDRSWRRRVMQAAAMLFFENQYGQNNLRIDGANVADAIYQQVIRARELPHTALYEAEGLDPSRVDSDLPLNTANVVDRWRQGYGLINLIGHGSTSGISRLVWHDDDGDEIPEYREVYDPPFLSYDDAALLDDRYPAIVFHSSCSNATPERPDNLAYGLLQRGAVATISSTRVVLLVLTTGPTASQNIFGLSREFVRLLLDGAPVAEALLESKDALGEDLGQLSWFTRLEINLYGDPSLTLTNCQEDADCDDGQRCNGVETCVAGQCEAGTPVSCDADDPCVEARCDESTGACESLPRPEGEACDDQRFCTINDRCILGTCVGEPRCAAPNNPCVRAVCNESTQTCDLFIPLEPDRICHAGTDREGVCRDGVCVPTGGGCTVGAGRSSDPPLAALLALALLLACLWSRSSRGGSHRRTDIH